MPLYQFKAEDGEELELYFSLGEAPHLGEWIEQHYIRKDGTRTSKAFQRVIEVPQLANSKGGMVSGPIVSECAPNRNMVEGWEKQAKKYGLPMPARAPGYDEHGRATFRNVGELHEYAKKDGRFVVGNPGEACQDMRNAPGRAEAKREAGLKAIDAALRAPEVL